jgi:hypothetical protein
MNEISEMIDTRINQKMAEVVTQTDAKIKAAVDPIHHKMDWIDDTLNLNFKDRSTQMSQLLQSITVGNTIPAPVGYYSPTHSCLAAPSMYAHGSATHPPNE